MRWIDSLKVWRRTRNITTPQGVFVSSMAEELDEYALALQNSDEHGMVDAIADGIVISANELALMGYDVDLVMKQVVKHISARQQDPDQLVSWLTHGPKGKWQKWKDQPKETLVEPDYTVCKLQKVL